MHEDASTVLTIATHTIPLHRTPEHVEEPRQVLIRRRRPQPDRKRLGRRQRIHMGSRADCCPGVSRERGTACVVRAYLAQPVWLGECQPDIVPARTSIASYRHLAIWESGISGVLSAQTD
jgi:hypothetical protein